MDPLTAFGLAANIYTFVDVGYKAVRQFNELRRGGRDAIRENTQAQIIANELECVSKRLETDGPDSFKQLATECRNLCQELLDLLDNEKHSNLNGKLNGIEDNIKRLSESRSKDFSQHRLDLLTAVSACTGNTELNSICEKLSKFQDILASSSLEISILMQLRFENIFDREDGIKNPTDGTFSWGPQDEDVDIVDPQPDESTHQQLEWKTQFTQWLRAGHGIFHISGKAGSGDRHLLYAAFFFWISGSDNQKRLTGLYRSILFFILNEQPSLIPDIFPTIWNGGREVKHTDLIGLTRPSAIEKAFRTLLTKATGGDHCLCLLIDGLDEYDATVGDYWMLARRLRDWAAHSHGNIKICVSSRPHDEFKRTFSPNYMNHYQIHLHDLNKHDIEIHCRNMFTKDEDFHQLKTLQERCEYLIREIVRRSEGVFLWAVLVVRIILSEARKHGTGDHLIKKLDELPGDMNKLYDKVLGGLPPADRKIANRILLVVLTNPFDIGVNALGLKWLVDEYGQQKTDSITDYTLADAENNANHVNDHLDGWTRGLIEARISEDSYLTSRQTSLRPALETRVKFFHRTLADYLLQPEKFQELRESCPQISLADIHAHLRLEELKYFVTVGLGQEQGRYIDYFILSYGHAIFRMPFQARITRQEKCDEVSWHLVENLARFLPNFLSVSAFNIDFKLEHGGKFSSSVSSYYHCSTLHFAACLGHSFIKEAIRPQTKTPFDTGPSKMSLILSASLSRLYCNKLSTVNKVPSEDLVTFLLEQGYSAHEKIWLGDVSRGLSSTRRDNLDNCASVWMILISYLLNPSRENPDFSKDKQHSTAHMWFECRLAEIIKIIGIILDKERQEEVLIVSSLDKGIDGFLTLEDLIRICISIPHVRACIPDTHRLILDNLQHWPKYESGNQSDENTPTWLWDVASRVGKEAIVKNDLTKMTVERCIDMGFDKLGLYAAVSRTTWISIYDKTRWFLLW
ncbi:hypothetical protein F5B19DRAFT_492397 [Rostrohypoxylon terebratum]|nr:hypothetical protein F5B19DRAFT_492397 [Rostrohypoxylon terebratum]